MSTLTGLISSGGGGGVINSIQRGSVVGTATVTISSVDTSKTFVNVSFTSLGSTETNSSITIPNTNNPSAKQQATYGRGFGFGYGKAGGRAVLTNATTLDVTATDSNTTTYYEVIEYA